MTRLVKRCPCGHPSCEDWHVLPEVGLQGDGFQSAHRARLVARFLDLLDEYDDDVDALALAIGRDAQARNQQVPVDRRAGLRVTHIQIAILDVLDPDRAEEKK